MSEPFYVVEWYHPIKKGWCVMMTTNKLEEAKKEAKLIRKYPLFGKKGKVRIIKE